MILLLVSAALAAPDRLASTYTVGTEVTDIVASEDGLWVGWTDAGSGEFTVLDAGAFDPTAIDACSGGGIGGAAVLADDKGWTFFTGCDDGTVVQIDVSLAGEVTLSENVFTVGTGAVYAVETDGTTLYAIAAGEDESTLVAAVTLADGTDVEGYPATLQADAVEDSALLGTYLLVSHGSDDISKVILGSAEALLPNSSLGGRSLADIWPYGEKTLAYLADTGGGLVKFEAGDSDYIASLTAAADSITAVGISPDEGWMVLGAGEDGALLYGFDGGPGDVETTIDGATNITELAVIEGYALGATSDGSVHVLTDRPWVSVESVSPSSVVDGDTVTLSFSSDTAGTYTVVVGGDSDGTGGTEVASDSLSALESVSVDIVVGEDAEFEEGNNRVWVFVADGPLTGRAAGTVTVDNPPEQVNLTEAGVGFGDQTISVEFDTLDAADIAFYAVFIDIEPFSADEFPTGGPAFTGTDDISAPVMLTSGGGDSVSTTFYPLTNGTTYYVAVRAYDTGGLEGPMSSVRSQIPEETFSVSERVGEEGSYLPGICGVTSPGAGAGAVGLALAFLSRRRRVAALALVVGATAVASPSAQASEDEDEGPRTMNVQLRYGPITLEDEYLQDVFGQNPNEILWFEYGYASRFVDANFGIGFYQEMGWLQTADGVSSDEHDMFTLFPLALTVTGRLDLLDEQPIVPFGRIGVDYWMWKENWYVPDTNSMVSQNDGGKYGWHYGGGLLLLLDVLDRRAASRLEATTGINDTFLVAEYRNTNLITGSQQLDLSNWELSFGLKFDF